ncbi:NAD-dependent epimerase/dehydratase [Formosa agariphila KMM 3901]|uniref:NAD-dependent epimerase/dehydratase n=1 Tax=Formosa agariphila (strain DSM 15362 / KCTC 12365 / LMG 23005 / KMM 3901 / M-2Alg 35-1) TaxID=1347342 RepID=T2KLF9_FORAG|nr:SDR family oxidoreductase [Formosa agariphila]CDF79271.1 NAD-dependent epimerase/dehydratase [Formosa agariphila KMM 3901]
MENVLVVGATGTTGHKVVNHLKTSQDFEPIAMVRTAEQEQNFKAQNIRTVHGDLEQDVSHTVVEATHVIFAAGSGGKKVEAVDQDGAIKMIKASETGNIKKFIMLSSMGADNPKQSEKLQDYLQAKHNADVFLKDSKLNYTIVRPGTLNNNAGQGRIQLAKSLSKQGEISRDDVAQTLIQALRDHTTNTTTFEILEGETPIEEALQNIQ